MSDFSKYKVLITGACGVTSRAVVRALKKSKYFSDTTYIGTDICENLYGIYEGLYKKVYKVPLYNSEDYPEVMSRIIKKEKIDAAIIIPEPEVLIWSANEFPVKYIVPPLKFSETVINKASLYKILKNSGWVPEFEILSREEIFHGNTGKFSEYPLWIRDFSMGSTSGKGALKISSAEEAKAWVIINAGIDQFMLSEYLPGGNYACHLLYDHGELLKVASYERLKYFLHKVAPSGITGNISRGRLINNKKITDISIQAVQKICNIHKEKMHGIVAVDLKGDHNNRPYITEINIRHVAATSSFADAGFNLAEYHLLLSFEHRDLLDPILEKKYPEKNLILRDIDGIPVWIPEHKELEIPR